MLLNIVGNLVQFLVLIFGGGLIVRRFFLIFGDSQLFKSTAFCFAAGMSLLAFVGYFLAIFSFFNITIAKYYLYLTSITCIFYLSVFLVNALNCIDKLKNSYFKIDIILDVLLFVLILPTLALALITPITNGDGLHSFNTWAMHWGLRNDMSDYWFLGYGQFLPIVSSWGYKLSSPWQGGIPDMQFSLHGSYVYCVFLGLLIIKRIPMVFNSGWEGSLLGFVCALLLFIQEDIFHDLRSGKAEPIIFLYEGLITLLIVQIHESKTHSKILPYLIGILVASLMFIKPSVVPLGILFLIAYYVVEIKVNISNESKFPALKISNLKKIYLLMMKSLVSPLISGLLVLSLVGPFYFAQYRYIGNVGYSSPQNMSFGGGEISAAVKSSAKQSDASFISKGKTTSSAQLLLYRISEVFMIESERGKTLGKSVRAKHILIALIIFIGVILSFQYRWLWTLHLAAFIQTWLWYIYASYGYYDLVPAIILFIILAGIGYAKVLNVSNKKSAY